MNIKHTPGDWWQDENEQYMIYARRSEDQPYSFLLAETCGYNDEREANARLITQAPALLALLQEIVVQHEMGLYKVNPMLVEGSKEVFTKVENQKLNT